MTDLQKLGWDDLFQSLVEPSDQSRIARVAADWGDRFTILGTRGEATATARGAQRGDARPTVGDWVVVGDAPGDQLVPVERVLERRSVLARKTAGLRSERQVLAANVDLVFVVQGLDGDFNLRRLERTATAVWECGAEPVVLLNKLDVADHPEAAIAGATAAVPGVTVYTVCALDGRGVEVVPGLLATGRTGVLVGSSGAGKSTLVNHLLGEERQRTAAVREADSRGRHATTSRRLFLLPSGGALIDGPGIRELQLWEADDGLTSVFPDIEELATRCRFRDCAHDGEPGCAVGAAAATGTLDADRLASFHKLRREAAFVERQRDVFARREETRRWKLIHKAHRRFVKGR